MLGDDEPFLIRKRFPLSALVIDGKAIAHELRIEYRARAAALKVRTGVQPGLDLSF